NRDAGVEVAGPAGTGNLIETNFILDNGRFDVTGDGQPDLDTTNPSAGVRITTSNNFVGEAVGAALAGGGNIISGNLRGVYIAGAAAQGNILLNNEIGTDVGIAGATPPVRGTSPRRNAAFAGNLLDGVLIQDATLNVVGGAIANARNVIAASGVDGVSIQGRDASGNRVLGNFIGFNFRNGIIYFMPNRDGVNVTSANNAIGGPTEAARNFIIENRRNGITIIGPTATGNQVQGNFIGTFQGGEDVGNTFEGVLIQDATDNVVGGTAAGVRNVISGNNNGVVIRGPRASGNRVQGNFIGTASDGATDLGNAVEGVLIDDAPRNTIGGTTAEARNIISGNNRGVRLAGAGASGNLVQGNFIGTDVTGTRPLGNSLDGVLVAAGASGNAIGGVDPAAGNTIAFNGGIGNVVTAGLGNGVLIESGTGNPILSNRIFTNNLLGIDLGGDGVTPNDPRDGDGGPNNLQNAPVLTGASTSSVRGVLNSTPNTTFLIQFFGNAQTDPSGLGEGQAPIGSTAVTTDAAGNATFAVTLAAPLAEGQFVTATATSTATNDTSEFSNAISNAPAILQFSGAPFFVDEGASTATITVTRTGNTGGTVSVAFATGDGTAIAGADYLSTAGTLTFNPGVTNLTFTIPIVQDALIEPNETVNLSLGTTGPPGGALLGPQSTAALTIRDDDGVTVQVAAADVIVGEGDGVASITVTRSNGVGTATVDFVTGDGTATATADYLSVAGTIRFGPGDTAVTITVPIVQDDLRESNETFFVALRNPTGVTLGAGTATVTIVDDDAPGAFQLGQAAYAVLEGQRFATITVTRVGGSGG
ncbi:MAG TPA: Calx-beta domain-containing protein, partial [Isosphaeraceae bacterium]